MATQPQRTRLIDRKEINRENAQHSTGPRTTEGKQRVRTNALKHGLTSQDIFLAEGESERYESLLARLINRWQPELPGEHDLVFSLRDAIWRRNSIPVLQINLATLSTEEHMEAFEHLENPAAQRASAQISGYRANARLFDQLSRHEGRFDRMIKGLEGQLSAILKQRESDRAEQAQKPRPTEQTKQTQPPPPPESTPANQTQPAPQPASTSTKTTVYVPTLNTYSGYDVRIKPSVLASALKKS